MGNFSERIADEVRSKILDDLFLAGKGVYGDVYWVLEDSDPNYATMVARHPKNVFTTLKDAYDAATTNQNDVIYMSAYSTHAVATGFVWSKNRINVIGMDSGERLVQQGTKISGSATDSTGYVLKVTGVRNSFRNIKFIQASTNAAALSVVQLGGEGTLFKNCSFIFEVIDNLDQTNAYEVVCGEDSGTFIDCQFGSDVLLTSAARAVVVADVVTAGQEMKDCYFRNCDFRIMSSSATAHFFRVLATTDLKFANIFVDCNFLAAINQTNSAVTLAEAVSSVASLVEGNVLFVRPACNTTDFTTATGSRNTNFKVVAAVSAAAAIEGIVPTA